MQREIFIDKLPKNRDKLLNFYKIQNPNLSWFIKIFNSVFAYFKEGEYIARSSFIYMWLKCIWTRSRSDCGK